MDLRVGRSLGRSVVAGVAAALLVAGALPAAADERFVDDDGEPAERALEWLADRGVIDGCDPPANRMACPERVLTRAEAAKILVLLGREEGLFSSIRPGSTDPFADDATVWKGTAEPFIDHLADLGVVHGCDPPDNRSFCPHDTLRRGQIAKMVVRAFELEAPEGHDDPWKDTSGRFYEEAAAIAAHHGLFDASDAQFDGEGDITRAEFATVVVEVFAPDLCPDDPFTAGGLADLETEHPGVSFTAYAYDLHSGCAFAMRPEARNQTASVFKVMVMAGTLLEAQLEGRRPTSADMALLGPMITESANAPVRDLWASFGGAPWFAEQTQRFGLEDTAAVGDDGRPWGRTTTSAHDQADLLRQVLVGEWGPLDAESRQTAFDLMTSVVPSQTWGATEGVPSGWSVAQKNGFAGSTANSVGVVFDEELQPVYVVAILTYGWSWWEEGVPSVERIGGWVSDALAE